MTPGEFLDSGNEPQEELIVGFDAGAGAPGVVIHDILLIKKGLRRIEWVIFGLKTRERWGLQGDFAFYGIWNLSMTDEWHEHRNVDGGFGIHIRFLVFDRNRQCAAFLVTRKRA
jgi:hypothetical protein